MKREWGSQPRRGRPGGKGRVPRWELGRAGWRQGGREQDRRVLDSASLILCWALDVLFPIMSLPYHFARHDWQLCLVIYLITVIFLTGFLVIF